VPATWIRYGRRGKRLNEHGSSGSVRYATESETAADLRKYAGTQGLRPNIRNAREEALALIAELKSRQQG